MPDHWLKKEIQVCLYKSFLRGCGFVSTPKCNRTKAPPFGNVVMNLPSFPSTYLWLSVSLTSQRALSPGHAPSARTHARTHVTPARLLGPPCASGRPFRSWARGPVPPRAGGSDEAESYGVAVITSSTQTYTSTATTVRYLLGAHRCHQILSGCPQTSSCYREASGQGTASPASLAQHGGEEMTCPYHRAQAREGKAFTDLRRSRAYNHETDRSRSYGEP